MTKTARKTGINGALVRKLRRRERWSQAELAEKLAVHRVTLARWESNLVDPPPEAADRIAQLFGVSRDSLFQEEKQAPEEGLGITDPWLKKISLFKLQKYTRPALLALELSAQQLAHRVNLPVSRLQELLNGEKPTTQEIQSLREQLGPDYNPSSILKKRILLQEIDPESTSDKLDVLLKRVNTLETRLEQMSEKMDLVLKLLQER
ncbi:hypothetical protein ABS71_02820 [bacterium SCN 62-11]|nr:helix-turn-helix transcriptional regulator [Candidatus Eremiobacteraeota bacterium]ODT77050.1 MAG: hypothetical protein ABS71_02820 [bacterium SCN 62-11]